ncbi:hypothetical protein CK625_06430 [Vandammella animalimorsus]|uniref:IPTL-CTERM protein sorting domain-containing protein n=1 Tax=Vandammella animalimorsus TaxID=2029117 RepID=A0A2A2AHG7_9BURK|nr:hypothetical protein CK625_06430 [Vandammella animalimorsus]
MFMLKKISSLCAIFFFALAAHAQQVLFLSTHEPGGGGAYYLNGVRDSLQNAGATVDDQRGLLSQTTAIDGSLFAGKDLVVLMTIYQPMDAVHLPVLKQAMLNNPNLTFAIFSDGCCEWDRNLKQLVGIVNEATGWSMDLSAQPYRFPGGNASLPLNGKSPYRSAFTAVDPMRGHDYRLITKVPAENALYLHHGTTTAPDPGTETNAYGLFIPKAQNNKGQGACVFLTGDSSNWAPDQLLANQRTNLGKTMVDLSRSEYCKQPQVITFPPQPAQTFSPNGTFTLSGVKGGDSKNPVTYSSSTPTVCTVDAAGKVTMLAAGDCTIAADQAGNDNYSAAAQVSQTIAIGKQVQAITFPAQQKQTFSPNGTFTLSGVKGGDSKNPVTYSSTTPTVCTVDANSGEVTMLAAGDCTIAANQAGNDNYSAAAPVSQTIVIGKQPQTITSPAQPAQTFVLGGKFMLSGIMGGASGEPLSYSSVTPDVCTVDANSGEVTMLAAGECVLEIKQAGNASYDAATTARLTIMLSSAAALSPTPVPVMGPWGLMLLALVAAVMGALRLRRD